MKKIAVEGLFKLLFIPLFIVCIPTFVAGKVITSDTVWEGEVLISEDIIIPEGITLSIKPGTIIKMSPAETAKTDPEYMSRLTEITVRGILKAEGKRGLSISFLLSGENNPGGWAGIIIDGGTAHLRSCKIQDAESGIYVIKGSADIKDSILRNNRYGLVAQGKETTVNIENTKVTENEYGIFSLNEAKVSNKNNVIKGNKRKDVYSRSVKDYRSVVEYTTKEKEIIRRYGNEALLTDTVWEGRIEIDGVIRIPEGSRLLILPGTVVEFKKKDTNGDGIGENGLLIQGVFIAKGTKEDPIIFRSAEKQKKMGDWDAINIMNSDGAQNLIEYCQIEDAYRGLHFHFSNVAVKESVLRNNYRGMQFQESVVEIKENYFYGNKSGIQARDSEIILTDNYLCNNYSGANFFRVNINAKRNMMVNNYRDGLRIREGIPAVEENLIDGNRYGLMVSDSLYGSFNGNVISDNLESGISLKGTDNVEITGNFIQGNGFNGISIQDSRAVIKGNNISENGERGIGIISFDGIITGNNFMKNGLYAIGLDGGMDIAAPMNWWGGSDVEEVIYDKNDAPSRGRIKYEEVRKEPFIYTWPVESIVDDITWYGDINIKKNVTVLSGTTLALKPGVRVLFSKGAGLKINGKIIAEGGKDKRITFTSLENNVAGDWNEIFLEHANGSIFSNCDFEYATWGIHSHFTQLTVEGCHFSNNYGGIRLRSGPVEVKHSIFEGNSIGIRAYLANATIIENVIMKNNIGIFVREKGGGLTIKRNNLFSNAEYSIRLGDFNNENVNAIENYWGNGNPADTIFDERKEPGIGRVIYKPYLEEPLKIVFTETK
jgi:parallel beta-helix repeat protein